MSNTTAVATQQEAETKIVAKQAGIKNLGRFFVNKAKPSSPRILIYGQGGVGKTTFAAKFPEPLFLCTERGLNSAELTGMDYIDNIHTWREFMEILDAFSDSKFKTLIIDTLDELISGIFNKHICGMFSQDRAATGVELADFAAINYGKGTVVAQQEIKVMLNKLDSLNSNGKIIILLAHSQVKNFKNPNGEDYDTYAIKGNDKINDVIKCWCDEVYFANFVVSLDKDGKAKGGKTRWLETENSAAWFAKSRFGLQGLEMDATSVLNTYRDKIRGSKNEQNPN